MLWCSLWTPTCKIEPAEIHRFLSKLDEGYDLVSGWKRVRHDPWHKVWPSRVFNGLLSRLGGVSLHDHNCGFKCYRAEVVRDMTLYGEFHRMLPCLAGMKGYRAAEIEVRHHPRTHGRSKYGFERFLRGFFDMLTVWFLRRFGERPAHFVGGLSLAMLAAGVALLIGAALVEVQSSLGLVSALLGAAFVASSPGLLVTALVAEMLNRGGLERQWKLHIAEDTGLQTPPSSSDWQQAVATSSYADDPLLACNQAVL